MEENKDTLIRRSIEQPSLKYFKDYQETYKIVSGASTYKLSEQIFNAFIKDSTFTNEQNRNESMDAYLVSVVESVLSKKSEDRSLNVYLKYGSKTCEDGEIVETDDVTNVAVVHGNHCMVLNTNNNEVSGFIASIEKLGIGENFEDLEYFMSDCKVDNKVKSVLASFNMSIDENREGYISQTHLSVGKSGEKVLYIFDTTNCSYDDCGNLLEAESYDASVGQVKFSSAEHGSHNFDESDLSKFNKEFKTIKDIIVNPNEVQEFGMQE